MGRLKNIFRAIWNAMLGRAEDKHYGELLDLTFDDLQEQVVKVKQGLASVAQSKHTILQLVKKNREDALRYEEAARNFLAAGDEDRARQALDQKAYVDGELTALQADLDSAQQDQDEFEATSRQLEVRVQQFKSKKERMKADHTLAKASVEIGETFTGISNDAASAGRTIGRMEERTNQLKARAAGINELMSSGALDDAFATPGSTALDRSAAELTRKAGVDADLDRLRKELEPAKTS
jgi:phage shock protein A